jgi:hypothetical protein
MSTTTIAAGLSVLSIVIAGCGVDRNVAPPSGAGGSALVAGTSSPSDIAFDDLPLPGSAEKVGARTEEDGATIQSYAVAATRPAVVMEFFVDALAERGWSPVGQVEDRGSDSLFGAWTREGRRLEVSAGPAPAIPDDTQFNLVLLPDLEPGRTLDTAP